MSKKAVKKVDMKVNFRVTYAFESEEELEKLMTALGDALKSDQTKDLFMNKSMKSHGELLSLSSEFKVDKVSEGGKDWESGVGIPGAEQSVMVRVVGLGVGDAEDGGVICKMLGLRNSSTIGSKTEREYIYEASKPPEWWDKLKVGDQVDVTYRRFGTTRRMLYAKATHQYEEEEKALHVTEGDDSDNMWGG